MFSNHLLCSLTPGDLGLLSAEFVPVRLGLSDSFENRGQPIERVCFPEAGFISVVAVNGGDRRVEAGLIGFEGMTGVPLLMCDDRSPNDSYVQMAGHGHTLTADAFRSAIEASPTLRNRLLQYAQTFVVQVAQTALANSRAKVEERLARWLLMADDRAEGSELALTHDFLSIMLGVRRPGVTDALHRLEGERLVWSRRSKVTIRNRAGLERVALNSYGVFESEYDRHFGSPWRSTGTDKPRLLAS